MLKRALIAVVASIVLMGFTVGWAQQRPGQATKPETSSTARGASSTLDTNAQGVRLLLGVGDEAVASWDGKVSLDQGEVLGVEGWRFRAEDEVTGADSWKAGSLPIRRVAAKKAAPAKAKTANRKEEKGGPSNSGAAITPTGVVVQIKAPPTATLTVTTAQGEAAIKLADLAGGASKRYLDGRIDARLTPAHATLVASVEQEDFPAAVSDGKAGAWIAYVAHQQRGTEVSEAITQVPQSFKSLIPEGGGDQIKLLHFDGTRVERQLDITGEGLDVWRPAVATDGKGRLVVAWAQMVDGNWDLYARYFDQADGKLSGTIRLTDQPGTDSDVVLTRYGDRVWMAWQAWNNGQADIWAALVPEPGETKKLASIVVAGSKANEWSPSISSGDGAIYVAYDSYEAGNYDVKLTRFGVANAPEVFKTVSVADSPLFEARPSLAVDSNGLAWVAYEERAENWGKDFGNIPDDPGTGLYQQSVVRVRCVEGDRVLDAGNPVASAPQDEQAMNAFARLVLDRSGRPHLLFRHRQEAIWGNNSVMVVGGVWVGLVTMLVGDQWTAPQPLARSDNLLDNRPALVAAPDGEVAALVVYSGDGRLHREVEHTADLTRRFYTHSGTPPGVVNNDLFVAAIHRAAAGAADPSPGGPHVQEASTVAVAHPEESEAVARMRSHRVFSGGKVYQLLRGEFHRHTEISQDGGNDGALEDMWRYALDAGRLDWIGCGDHDNGGGKEYTWWLTQKTTDLYHNAPAFVPMHTYERSVSYPGGHRNVMFPYRGVRTLPRLVDERGVRTSVNGRDLDAQMLYKYLNELGGICAVHTSGTGMGTDWRENDPNVEPFVEIYQGIRDSYEHFGAPRVAHGPGDAIGGWRPLGMVWNALAMQYKIGFQSSSDHVSTHISFAIAIAEKPTREAIFDAFKKRHCYAATDNILLDVRCGDHLMGDEFVADGPVTLKIQAHGTGPIKKLDIIKDFHYVYSSEPGTDRVEFTWTDDEAINRRPSWYYVRVLQENGEIAWGSPMWIQAPPAAGRRN